MTEDSQNKAVAKLAGVDDCKYCPDYVNDFTALYNVEAMIDYSLELRIAWSNHLHAIVARRCPRNKSGASLASNIDILRASSKERTEALLKTFKLWEIDP